MNNSLSKRISNYIEIQSEKFIPQLPIVIYFNGKNFTRVCKKMKKPFDEDFDHTFLMSVFYTIKEIPTVSFAYQFLDKAMIVLSPSKNPWMDNNKDKIISVSSSYITGGLKDLIANNTTKLDIVGDIVFEVTAFALPKFTEVVNYFVAKQNKAYTDALNQICLSFLTPKIGKHKAVSLLSGKKNFEKQELLSKQFEISIENYSKSFYMGNIIYKKPLLVSNNGESVMKNKWHVEKNVEKFNNDKIFLLNIFKTGHDIFRV